MQDNSNNPSYIEIRFRDMLALAYSFYKAKDSEYIGYCDDYFSEEELEALFMRTSIKVRRDMLESYLFNANMLNEIKLFQDPLGRSFNSWVKDLLSKHKNPLTFDRKYSILEDVNKDRRRSK